MIKSLSFLAHAIIEYDKKHNNRVVLITIKVGFGTTKLFKRYEKVIKNRLNANIKVK
ncbi:hypothetical protein MHTCC0001_15200 [Flavobacteriaceae bacterium MHTCC 0001]